MDVSLGDRNLQHLACVLGFNLHAIHHVSVMSHRGLETSWLCRARLSRCVLMSRPWLQQGHVGGGHNLRQLGYDRYPVWRMRLCPWDGCTWWCIKQMRARVTKWQATLPPLVYCV